MIKTLTCSKYFVQCSVMLTWFVSWNVITQTNGRHGDETIIEGIQIVPVALQVTKDGGRDEQNN